MKDILTGTGREIKFRSFPGTQQAFAECLDMKPRGIHFCGHAVENSEENFGVFTNLKDGDYLILEDETANADFLSCKALKTILSDKKVLNDINFVFVTSSSPMLVGEIFLKAGIQHVVCATKAENTSNLNYEKFVRAFYDELFSRDNTVLEAFKWAQSKLEIEGNLQPEEEAKDFILLSRDEDDIEDYFNTSLIENRRSLSALSIPEGLLFDLTPVPKFNTLPKRAEDFIGRHAEIHDLITLIKFQRFVIVKGAHGIGKSAICKELANFLLERQMFKDGIIYVSLQNCESAEAVVTCLDSHIDTFAKKADRKIDPRADLVSQICDYFKERCTELLIILDDADQVLQNDRGNFRALIEVLLNTCPRIKIVAASRLTIGGGFQGFTEKVYNLSHLDKGNSKDLLLIKAPRKLEEDEIKELIEYKPTEREQAYMVSLHITDHHLIQKGDDSSRLKLLDSLNLTSRRRKESSKYEVAFENHPIMKILGGHPQSISLAAVLLIDKSLKELFQYITKKPLLETLKSHGQVGEEKNSFRSFQVSLDASLNYLFKHSKDSIRLFGLIGLMPAGASDEDLSKVWGDGWQEFASALIRSSLLLRTEKKIGNSLTWYSLYPFMTQYAEHRLNGPDRHQFSTKLAKNLLEKGVLYYNKLGTMVPDSKMNLQDFLVEELNFKAYINRELLSANQSKALTDSSLALASSEDNESAKKKSVSKKDTLASPLRETHRVSHQGPDFPKKSNKHSCSSCSERVVPLIDDKKRRNSVEVSDLNLSDSPEFIRNTSPSKSCKRGAKFSAYDKKKGAESSSDASANGEQENVNESNSVVASSAGDQDQVSCDQKSHESSEDRTEILRKGLFSIKKLNIAENIEVAPQTKLKTVSTLKMKPNIHLVATTPTLKTTALKADQTSLKKPKMKRCCHITVLYASILFVLRRYKECQKSVLQGFDLTNHFNDRLGLANLIKLRACLLWMKKDFKTSLEEFSKASELFKDVGSSLGIAISDTAIGYLKANFMGDNNAAIKRLENALSIYKKLNHAFAIHFIHRWLSIIMNKLPNFKTQSRSHAEAAHKVLLHHRKHDPSRHKAGTFIIRWMGDVFSILLELATVVDLDNINLRKKKEDIDVVKSPSSTVVLFQKRKTRQVFPNKEASANLELNSSANVELNSSAKMNKEDTHGTPTKNKKSKVLSPGKGCYPHSQRISPPSFKDGPVIQSSKLSSKLGTTTNKKVDGTIPTKRTIASKPVESKSVIKKLVLEPNSRMQSSIKISKKGEDNDPSERTDEPKKLSDSGESSVILHYTKEKNTRNIQSPIKPDETGYSIKISKKLDLELDTKDVSRNERSSSSSDDQATDLNSEKQSIQELTTQDNEPGLATKKKVDANAIVPTMKKPPATLKLERWK